MGGRSNYNKYLSDGFLDSEKEPIKQLFKKRLPWQTLLMNMLENLEKMVL